MGSYASLYVGGYELASSKSFVDPTVMMLFTERDKRIRMPEPGDLGGVRSALNGILPMG